VVRSFISKKNNNNQSKTNQINMNKTKMMALVAIASATAVSAHAQFADNDLVIGFTTSGSTGDLAIDLGQASALFGSSTTVNLNTAGNTGFTSSGLASALTQNGLTINGLSWGVVGGIEPNNNNWDVIYTVAHGASAGAANGSIVGGVSDVETVGQNTLNGKGSSAVTDPTAGNGDSYSEAIASATGAGSFVSDTSKNPNSKTPAGTFSQTEDIYEVTKVGGVLGTPTLEGTITLDNLGDLTFTPVATAVPEPSTYGLIGGLGLLALSLRRQFASKQS
jgi:PEP-CTERM motif